MYSSQMQQFNDILIRINGMKANPLSFDLKEDKAIVEQAVKEARYHGPLQ